MSDKTKKKEIKSAINRLKSKIYSGSIQVSIFENDDKILEDDYKLFKDSFEWAFEFPEILGENGEFLGFDCIIGNPPYGATLDELSKDYCKKKYEDVHMRTPDTQIPRYLIHNHLARFAYDRVDFFSVLFLNLSLLPIVHPTRILQQTNHVFSYPLCCFQHLRTNKTTAPDVAIRSCCK